MVSVIVIGPNSLHQLGQSTLVFQVNPCDGNSGASLPEDQPPQPELSLDDEVGGPPSFNPGQVGKPPAQWDLHHGQSPPAALSCSPPWW